MGMSSDYELYNIPAKKDLLSLVTSVFCYILSLQFLWIFVFLDVKTHIDRANSKDCSKDSDINHKIKKTISSEKASSKGSEKYKTKVSGICIRD